jgi:hypothetical protein
MTKFRVKLKLTGLELEIEGSREDVPQIAKTIGMQLGGIIAPAAAMAEGKPLALGRETIDVTPGVAPPTSTVRGSRGGKHGRRASASAASDNGLGGPNTDTAPTYFDFRHDADVWGTPIQTWNTADKAMWLLHIAAQQNVAKEMTGPQIANTFNRHFRQAGTLLPHNITRDLGKQKSKPPPKVNEDTTKDPAAWYLTEAGIKYADVLVKKARGESSAPAAES